ncbi:transposable element Tc3 transposase [Trichonephila clavipes]|nr:transposable element Tc3 transposase [Trichonephila clavipes]
MASSDSLPQINLGVQAGLNQDECVQRLQLVLGNESLCRVTVFIWFKEFCSGRNFLQDEERTGKPWSAVIPDNVSAIRKMLMDENHRSYQMTLKELNIGSAAIHKIIHEELNIKRVLCRCVQHNLTEQQKVSESFQQDGATCHTARATIDLLKDTFGDRLILRFGPVSWPPRSCDLTPLDYFLWGYVKSLVYEDKPQTLDHLEDNICRVIADIRPQMLEKVIENWTTRLDYIRASRGSHMPEIIFKMPPYMSGMKETVLVRAALLGTGSRREETTLARFRSGHTRAQQHEAGPKVFPNCQNFNMTQAAPAHILAA